MDTVAEVAVADQPHTPPSGGGLFALDPGLAIWTWVVFGLLFIVLRKYAWGPMTKSIGERERMMTEAVENARKVKEELETIAQRQKAMLQATEEQARAIVEAGRRTAEAAAQEIADRAREQAEKSLLQAQEQIRNEKDRALEELRQQAVDMVIATSGKLIAESLDDEQHRRIVERELNAL